MVAKRKIVAQAIHFLRPKIDRVHAWPQYIVCIIADGSGANTSLANYLIM